MSAVYIVDVSDFASFAGHIRSILASSFFFLDHGVLGVLFMPVTMGRTGREG